MKKILAIILAAVMAFSLVGCGGNDEAPDGDVNNTPVETPVETPAETPAVPALDVFTQVWNLVPEDSRPMSFGGDYNEENQVENAPGKHEIGDGTELDSGFGFPTDMTDSVKEAATIRHMLNVNSLSAAMYLMADGADISAFAQGIRDSLMNRAYMCGWPEVLVVMSIDGKYVLSAYGTTDLVYALRDAAGSFAYDDGTVPPIDILYDESMENAGGDNTAMFPVPELG